MIFVLRKLLSITDFEEVHEEALDMLLDAGGDVDSMISVGKVSSLPSILLSPIPFLPTSLPRVKA